MRIYEGAPSSCRHAPDFATCSSFTAEEVISMINAAHSTRGDQPFDQDSRPR